MGGDFFQIVSSDPACQAILGTLPMRLWAFGEAPQGGARPYAVWSNVAHDPQLFLSGRPDVDNQVIEVECYAETQAGARALAEAIRDSLEMHHHVTGMGSEGRDTETRLYVWSLTVECWVSR